MPLISTSNALKLRRKRAIVNRGLTSQRAASLRLERFESRDVPSFVGSFVDVPATAFNIQNVVGELNGKVILYASDATHGRELWQSDGTAAGTTMLKDINPGIADSSIQYWTVLNGIGYFLARDADHGRELWRTDGTEVGTYMVADINPGTASGPSNGMAYATSQGRSSFRILNNTLYFVADNGTHGAELWRSDGTAASTSMVADINPGAGSSSPRRAVNMGSFFCFDADDGVHGYELWRSDGSAAGTALVKDIQPGTAPSISWLCYDSVNGLAIFGADDGVHGGELWRSDGTTAGTELVLDVVPGPGQGLFGLPAKVGNGATGECAYFYSGETGAFRFWRTDGTTAGTYQPNPSMTWWTVLSTGAAFPTSADDGVYFGAKQFSSAPPELWKSDGTGVFQLTNWGSNPGVPEFVNGRAFFNLSQSATGREPWTDNGFGVDLIQDIVAGSLGSDPGSYASVGSVVFFRAKNPADTGRYGLWRFDTASGTPRVSNTRVNDGAAQRSRVTSLTVTFDRPVAFVGQVAHAFTLIRDGGKPVTFSATSNVVNGVTVVTLTNFSGASTEFGSLADGRYTLKALAGQIHVGGMLLDGNGDGAPGDDYTFGDAQGLYRRYADINGDRRVDGADVVAFVSTYGLFPGNAGFITAFDFNGDGRIDGTDFGQLVLRYGVPLP